MSKKITECELQVMKCIWDSDVQLTLPQILDEVNKRYGKEWKAPTVSTFLARLVGKGFLSMQRTGRTFIYTAEVPLTDFRGEVLDDMVNFWTKGDAGTFICALHDQRPLRGEEKEKIKQLLNELG